MLSLKNLLSISILTLCFININAQSNQQRDSLNKQEALRIIKKRNDALLDTNKAIGRIQQMTNWNIMVVEGILLYQHNYPFNDNKQCLTKKYVLVKNVLKGDTTYVDHVLEIVTEDCDPEIIRENVFRNKCFKQVGDTAIIFVNNLFDGMNTFYNQVSKPNVFYGYGVNYNKNKPVVAYNYKLKNIEQLKRFIKTTPVIKGNKK